MKKLKVAVIGAGSTYTPELINGFLTRLDKLDVESFYMMDIDDRKNEIVSNFARRMVKNKGLSTPVVTTNNLEEALTGAHYVIAQLRVGRLPARILDEKIPLKHGLIGQETTGVGGFFKAMRTLPVMSNIADVMEKCAAPGAWLINFSNPSSILAEMLVKRTGINAVGLCNAPIGFEKNLRHKTENPADFAFDYVGLNHLSWITGVTANGKDVIGDLLKDPEFTHMAGSPNTDFLESIGGIPSYYLNYFYNHEKCVKEALERPTTRGEDCVAIEEDLLKMYQDENLVEKPDLLDKRGGAFYSEAAVSLVEAIENDLGTIHVVNTNHQGTLPFLADGDIAEVKCIVGKDGPKPLPLNNPNVNPHIIGMIQAVKAYEKLAVKAGLEGDRKAALAALLTHPIVGDSARAQGAFDDLLEAHKAYLPQFFK